MTGRTGGGLDRKPQMIDASAALVTGRALERPLRCAVDDAASTTYDAAAVLVAHGNMGSRRRFRRCRIVSSCTAANSCNSRTCHLHLLRWNLRHRPRTMDKNKRIGHCQLLFRPATQPK